MSISRFLLIGAIAFLGMSATGAIADDDATEVNSADLDGWIEQLDAAEFSKRQDASKKLTEAGAAAIPALEKVAQGGAVEPAARSMDILKKHFAGKDEALKTVAEKALQRLADSNNPIASRRAKAVLNPPKPMPQPIGNNRFQRMQMKVVNGVKEINVETNGRKIWISDDPQNGIQMEVAETDDNGKADVKKFAAKNAEELKKEHPEAHKLYEEYTKGRVKIQIRGLPFGIRPGGDRE